VFVFHLFATFRWRPARFTIDGYAGVAFFFVLSGFVLTWSLGDRAIDARRFYRARFARIYPTYLVCFVAAWLLTPAVAWWVVAGNATLVQAWIPASPNQGYSIDLPSWSVSCEITFYALLPLLVRVARRWSELRCLVVACAWFAVCSLATYEVPRHGDRPRLAHIVYLNPAVRSGEFLLGTAACRLVQAGRLQRLRVSWSLVAVVVSFVLLYQWPGRPFPCADVFLTPAFFALICAAAHADVARRDGVLTARPLRYLGEISYAFYVFQFIPLLLVVKHVHASATAQSALALVMTLAGTVVLHHAVERPLRAAITHRPQPPPASIVVSS
jgi:peptidoglycan/LPS O-acetylase OafA/YrhL